MSPRVIMHIDMDAYYASIEQRDRSDLRGKPVIVGHPARRGVVTTCSYEARLSGVRSAMPSVTAQRLCPQGIWVAPRMEVYREESQRIFTLVEREVPVVQKVSVDEAYGDLSSLHRSPEAARTMADAIRSQIHEIHGLTASIGLSVNRFLAKIGSDLEKPDGLAIIAEQDIDQVLGPLPARVIPGVGPKLQERLSRLGISTIADLRTCPIDVLKSALGARTALFLARRSNGEDDSPVTGSSERRQISEERTYRVDLTAPADVERELLDRAVGIAAVLRHRGQLARTVVLKARDSRFRTVTRSHTLPEPTDLAREIYDTALQLWCERIDFRGLGVRLLGVAVKELCNIRDVSPTLFPDPRRAREHAIARTADSVQARFGKSSLRPAKLIDPPGRS